MKKQFELKQMIRDTASSHNKKKPAISMQISQSQHILTTFK
jgi:hypothetical protein